MELSFVPLFSINSGFMLRFHVSHYKLGSQRTLCLEMELHFTGESNSPHFEVSLLYFSWLYGFCEVHNQS